MDCNTASTENNGRTPIDLSDTYISPKEFVFKQYFSGILLRMAFL